MALDGPVARSASVLIAVSEGHVLQRLMDPKALAEALFTRLLLGVFGRLDACTRVKADSG